MSGLRTRLYLVCAALVLGTMSAVAQPASPAGALDTFGTNRQPIQISADQLDVHDKDNKAIFIGNVIAVQGDSTLKCTKLEVFYSQSDAEATATPSATSTTTQTPRFATDNSSIRNIECLGPVTIVSKTQVATGDHATFDRKVNKVYLRGNVVLKDGTNVVRGDRLVHDVTTGIATVGGRVRTMIIPEGSTVGQ